MAGGQERILRGRIQSMQATKKITRAMELIAASRIVKAQQRVQSAVPYSDQITEVVRDLSAAGASTEAPLLAGRDEVKTKCYVVIAADRGLCGGYNAGVQRAAEGEVKADVLAGRGYEIIPVGRRVESYFRFREYDLGKEFGGFSDMPSYNDAKEIGDHVIDLFMSGEVDSVELIYTRFITAGSQEVVMRPLVPLSTETVEGGDGKDELGHDYDYEPDPTTILETLLPRYVEARVYAALLNAAASEHAFRQRAMKAATDNADELIKNLSIIMNRARQDAITTEIMEIVGGAEALSGDDDDGFYYPEMEELGSLGPTPGQAAHRGDGGGAGSGPGGDAASYVSAATTDTLVRDDAHDGAQDAHESVGEVQSVASGQPANQGGDASAAAPITESNPLGIRQVGDEVAPDDLTKVSGIGNVLREKLHGLGVRTFRQIAEWTRDEIDRVNQHLDFPGRIEREDWIAQSKNLHRDHHGEEL